MTWKRKKKLRGNLKKRKRKRQRLQDRKFFKRYRPIVYYDREERDTGCIEAI